MKNRKKFVIFEIVSFELFWEILPIVTNIFAFGSQRVNKQS